jgi:nucleoside-diphosphate-sugar epimerase
MDDVVDALLLAAARPVPAGSVFNIGSGSAMTVRELIERLLHLMGNPVKALIGALPMRPDEIVEMSASIAAANTQLGWTPRTSLDEGLRRTIAWFTEHRELAARLTQGRSDSVHETVGASR